MGPRTFFKRIYKQWRDVRPDLLAGGLAFFAILSATPLLIILIEILDRGAARGAVRAQLNTLLSPRMGGLVREWLLPAKGSGFPALTAFSVLMLLYAASQVFIQLRSSLNAISDVPVNTRTSWRGFFKSILAPLLMILATGLFVLAFILLDAGIGIAGRIFGTILPGWWHAALWKVASVASSFALFTIFFGEIFKRASPHELRWGDVWPGAVLTSGLFSLAKLALALYFSWRSFDSLYGMGASLIVIMVWVYVSAQIFIFGAVFTRVYSEGPPWMSTQK